MGKKNQKESKKEKKEYLIEFAVALTLSYSTLGFSLYHYTSNAIRLNERYGSIVEKRQGLVKDLQILKSERRKYDGLRTVFDDGLGNVMHESYVIDIEKAKSLDVAVDKVDKKLGELEESKEYRDFSSKNRRNNNIMCFGLAGTLTPLLVFLGLQVYRAEKRKRKSTSNKL